MVEFALVLTAIGPGLDASAVRATVVPVAIMYAAVRISAFAFFEFVIDPIAFKFGLVG